MREPIIGSSPNWPRNSRDVPYVWFDRAGCNQLVVTSGIDTSVFSFLVQATFSGGI